MGLMAYEIRRSGFKTYSKTQTGLAKIFSYQFQARIFLLNKRKYLAFTGTASNHTSTVMCIGREKTGVYILHFNPPPWEGKIAHQGLGGKK